MIGTDRIEEAAPLQERGDQGGDKNTNQQFHNITSDQAIYSSEWLWALVLLAEFDTRAAEVFA